LVALIENNNNILILFRSEGMKHRNKKAFTFIEIIVVIVIIGILAAVAVPKFMNLSGDAKKAAADGTIGAMESATSIAFAKHRAANLESSGKNDEQYITNPSSLEYYLDGGFPDNLTVSGNTITLQDGRKVTITAETNDARAQLTVK
jgi:MSHA pilin protein MshA